MGDGAEAGEVPFVRELIWSCSPLVLDSSLRFTGGSGTDPLRRLPPPSLEIGWKVPDHGRLKQILLELVEGEKMGLHPMCLYSKYSVF